MQSMLYFPVYCGDASVLHHPVPWNGKGRSNGMLLPQEMHSLTLARLSRAYYSDHIPLSGPAAAARPLHDILEMLEPLWQQRTNKTDIWPVKFNVLLDKLQQHGQAFAKLKPDETNLFKINWFNQQEFLWNSDQGAPAWGCSARACAGRASQSMHWHADFSCSISADAFSKASLWHKHPSARRQTRSGSQRSHKEFQFELAVWRNCQRSHKATFPKGIPEANVPTRNSSLSWQFGEICSSSFHSEDVSWSSCKSSKYNWQWDDVPQYSRIGVTAKSRTGIVSAWYADWLRVCSGKDWTLMLQSYLILSLLKYSTRIGF